MAHPTGESESGAIRLDFDRRLLVQFRGSALTSDAGLLAYRELDDALGPTAMASETLADARTGKNGRHALAGLFRQSVFGRLAGYKDVNDAERLRHDPAMRWIVGGKAFNIGQHTVSKLLRPTLDTLGIVHHTFDDEARMGFMVDSSIKQAVTTQAPVTFILSP